MWDSADARDRFFSERLAPAYAEVGLSLEGIERTEFALELLEAGDLAASPQLV